MDPSAGTVCLLTTTTLDGGLRTRPVTLFPAAGCDGIIFTGTDAAKLQEIRTHPAVTLAGPAPGGWWSTEASAAVEDTPAEAPLPGPVAGIRVFAHRTRRWTVHSPLPWDNTVEETTPGATAMPGSTTPSSPGRSSAPTSER